MNREQVIKEYKEQRKKEAKKVFIRLLENLVFCLLAGVGTIFFMGMTYLLFIKAGVLDTLGVWFLPLGFSAVASIMLAYFNLIGDNNDKR